MISFKEAIGLIKSLSPMEEECISSGNAVCRVLSRPVFACVNAPADTSSLKDGFAIRSDDVKQAGPDNPVSLQITDIITAGDNTFSYLQPGQAIKIMTGAPVPPGATAVLPQELTLSDGPKRVKALANSEPGRNILPRGSDIRKGEQVIQENTLITPGIAGLISGAGVSRVWVYRKPRISVLATGSELAEEGAGAIQGKIFPSNRATIAAWLKLFGIECGTELCRDDAGQLETILTKLAEKNDVVITSGGVLDGDRDMVISIMEKIGVNFMFKRCRIGPGKGVCMGRMGDKFFFNLPGGPPSNYVAFLFIALPAILRLMGIQATFPQPATGTVDARLKGRSDWTQLILARAWWQGRNLVASPLRESSRLKRIAFANAVIVLPEGVSQKKEGSQVEIRLLNSFPPG